MSEEKEIITMDYGDKQYFISLRGIVENKDGDNWEECEKELRESFETAQKAAEEGNPIGQFNLGMHYDYGFGVEESDEEAFKWYEKAAMQGHSDGMHYTAWAYGHGRGVEPDMEKRKVKTICETVKRILQIAEIAKTEYENDFDKETSNAQ